MRYSYEYKRKCVELYREGKWPEKPATIKNETDFHKMIRRWARMEASNGPDILRHKSTNKAWMPEERLELVSKVIAGNSLQSTALNAGISPGMLYQWVQKYKTRGYNGLVDMKKGCPSKESKMSRKKININNPRPLVESELEELIRLREENKYIKAENEVIKKEIALREEKQAALLKAKKQQSSKNYAKKDTN